MVSYIQSEDFHELAHNACGLLRAHCHQYGISYSHGLDHAKRVTQHVIEAIRCYHSNEKKPAFTPSQVVALYLAALYHDADDSKYFVGVTDHARSMSTRILHNFVDPSVEDFGVKHREKILSRIMLMIQYVSFRSNGNQVPPLARNEPEVLWPRFADRLEAIGYVGIIRTYQYTMEKGLKFSSKHAPTPLNEKELWAYVTESRYKDYLKNGSQSMMDHFYDKLLQIPAGFKENVVKNQYLLNEARKRVKPLLEICLAYGKHEKVPLTQIEHIASTYN